MAIPANLLDSFDLHGQKLHYYSLRRLAEAADADITRLPFTIKIFLENLLRHRSSPGADEGVLALAHWNPSQPTEKEIPFLPGRVLLQDFTGIPCILDLSMMRNAAKKFGIPPEKINPVIPADLIVDHSIQVDFFRTNEALERNLEMEYKRNTERYAFLRWAQKAFRNLRIVPPGKGICHQVNLEYLAPVVQRAAQDGKEILYPDTVLGTDSHTTMINGLGVLGWGVGGIEAEACLLGQPFFLPVPQVVGFRFSGKLQEGATATDLVLTVTEKLRRHGVVGKFVEFFGPGIQHLRLPDRATISNMAPEYGATAAYFPVDEETLRYLRETNRNPEAIEQLEKYTKTQELFHGKDSQEPIYTETLELDLDKIEACVAGPKRPQDRISLPNVKESLKQIEPANPSQPSSEKRVEIQGKEETYSLANGSIVIAAITSCTNTSNPSVMIAAGLLAKKAVAAGLRIPPHVKTSLAPGSRVVTDYLQDAGLFPYLEQLGFQLVGYGCTTCIGNSGPLEEPVASAVRENQLNVAAVLSGNRNFDGRINPLVQMSFLASPPLVVAYALAGSMNIDITKEPLGKNAEGKSFYLRDLWPSSDEIEKAVRKTLKPEFFRKRYEKIFEGDSHWESLTIPEGMLYDSENSTYILNPPFLDNFSKQPSPVSEISGAYVLALLGDSITTDHISPAGAISTQSPAGEYLTQRGVQPKDFNSFGARRGNHEVMARGTFGNPRIQNRMTPDREGGWTVYVPTGEIISIFEAAANYRKSGKPLLVIAGKEYGAGSSRDWAAKGALLLGVKAVLAESFERIHRSNLIGMGILPLQFDPGQSWKSLGLTGFEQFDIEGIAKGLKPHMRIGISVRDSQGNQKRFSTLCRLDNSVELEYYRNQGILPYVLRRLLRGNL